MHAVRASDLCPHSPQGGCKFPVPLRLELLHGLNPKLLQQALELRQLAGVTQYCCSLGELVQGICRRLRGWNYCSLLYRLLYRGLYYRLLCYRYSGLGLAGYRRRALRLRL